MSENRGKRKKVEISSYELTMLLRGITKSKSKNIS
jgi:hypothetical protein